MIEPRDVDLEPAAIASLQQILGIMTDHMWTPDYDGRWNIEHIVDLDDRLAMAAAEDGEIMLGIDDVALLLAGMAYTEMMSEEFPWIEAVRWVSDFVTLELRRHWSDDEWRSHVGGAFGASGG